MPSGQHVFLGGTPDESPRFHCHKAMESGVTKEHTLPGFCEHDVIKTLPSTCTHHNDAEILGIRVGSRELLAVSCGTCHCISLLNLETGEVSVAFNDPDQQSWGDV